MGTLFDQITEAVTNKLWELTWVGLCWRCVRCEVMFTNHPGMVSGHTHEIIVATPPPSPSRTITIILGVPKDTFGRAGKKWHECNLSENLKYLGRTQTLL